MKVNLFYTAPLYHWTASIIPIVYYFFFGTHFSMAVTITGTGLGQTRTGLEMSTRFQDGLMNRLLAM